MPVIVETGQFAGARDVELVRNEIGDEMVRQLGMPRIFGVGRRLVPPFRRMDSGRMLRRLFGRRRLVPHLLAVENGERRHQRIIEQFLLIIAEDDRDVDPCVGIGIGHPVDRRATCGMPLRPLGKRALFRQSFPAAHLHQRLEVIATGLIPMRLVGMIGGEPQQPLFGRRRQRRTMGGPHPQNNFSHRIAPIRRRA